MAASKNTRKVDANSAPVAPRFFAHAVFATPNYEEMIAWYGAVLNARVVSGGPMLSFMTFDQEHHRLAFINQPKLAVRDGKQAGIDHLAYTLPDIGALLNTYVRLKKNGILPVWPVNHGLTTSLYYQDPDGNRVELQVDNFATAEELQGWFARPEFAANPIGVGFDPEALIKLYESGAPQSELIRIGWPAPVA
ncbi:MAG: VOC family protein [Alphaproteobacteria bacterium]|nr:VOC family protein [Alphaproteobacteria bacterium]